jgi:hypothetical protein
MKVHLEKQDYSLIFVYIIGVHNTIIVFWIKNGVGLCGGIFSFLFLRIKLGSNGWHFQFSDELSLTVLSFNFGFGYACFIRIYHMKFIF